MTVDSEGCHDHHRESPVGDSKIASVPPMLQQQKQRSCTASPPVGISDTITSPPSSSHSLPFRPLFNGPAAATEINDTARHWHQWNSPEEMAVAFGGNKKAQMAARAMFDLVHQYGDNLREGWMNVLDCLLYMLKANLLPPSLVQLEDFVDPSGFISLKQRFKRRPAAPKKEESGLLSWLGLTGSSGAGGGESGQSRPRSEEEKELSKLATSIVAECHPEQIVLDSRYLAGSSLTELVNSIIHCSFTVAPVLCTLHGAAQQHQHDNQHRHSQQESQDEDSFVDLSNVAVPPAEMLRRAQTDGIDCEQQPLIRQVVGSTLSIESASSGDGRTSPHHSHNGHQHNGPPVGKLSLEEEEAMVFLLELMTNIVLENRDRLAHVWSPVRDYLRTLLSHFTGNHQLMERAVVSVIRIANRNLFRLGQHFTPTPPTSMTLHTPACTHLPNEKGKPNSEAMHAPNFTIQRQSQHIITGQSKSVVIVVDPTDNDGQQKKQGDEIPNKDSMPSTQQTVQDRGSNCADEVLHFLGCELSALRPPELFLFSRQIAFGLHQLLRANAANLHASEHWEMFFALLESVGAAAYRDEIEGAEMVELPPPFLPNEHALIFQRGTVVLASNLSRHDPAAFLKVCEILTFLARDAAHITPSNFVQFTRCLRTMVEASMDGGKFAPMKLPPLPSVLTANNENQSDQFPVPNNEQHESTEAMEQQKIGEGGEGAVGEQERLANCYMDASWQLLNICVQLHARAATIHKEWSVAAEVDIATDSSASDVRSRRAVPLTELWAVYWRPLLKAMARLSCDCRRRIRAQSLDALGNSFRVPAFSELMQPADWEDCFAEVLFPLLSKLLANSPPISPMDPIGMEEARIRAIQFTCKILLGNLTQIARLDSFAELLTRLFDLMDQFLEGNSCSDLLAEVIQESLKNCVLVCENFGIFRDTLAELHGQLKERLDALAKKHENVSSVGHGKPNN